MDIIKKRIETLFKELGFDEVTINRNMLYAHNGAFYKITYIDEYKSFVIEYAESYDEALKNIFWDGDWYPISLGEDGLLVKLRSDLVEFYISNNNS